MKRKSIAKNDRHELLTIAVLKQFRLIYGTVRQHFREVEERVGVSGSQVWMLREIGDAPGIGVSKLASKLSIHQSTCSLLVENMVAGGYILKKRQKSDQRRVGLSLTTAGTKILRHAPGPAEGLLPQALSRIPSLSLRSLSGHLDKVIAELRLRDHRHADKPLSDL
jgi:DNA-binding MarR family transcriptional regulator